MRLLLLRLHLIHTIDLHAASIDHPFHSLEASQGTLRLVLAQGEANKNYIWKSPLSGSLNNDSFAAYLPSYVKGFLICLHVNCLEHSPL